MDSTKRIGWQRWMTGGAILAMLFFATNAAADDRPDSHRGERINNHLDVLAAFAALSGEPHLADALDRQGDLIEYELDGYRPHDRRRNHDSDRWRKRTRGHRRHFNGCEHRKISHRSRHSRRSLRHSGRDRHDLRRKKHHRKRQNRKQRRHSRL